MNRRLSVVSTKNLLLLVFVFLLTIIQATPARSQSIKILGGNTLNGAMTGTILGGATMALRNSNDFDPLRIGLGAGTLFGIGVGVYDLSQVSRGQLYYISATFNDGENTSIIVLLDTFYGAAAGAIVATSFNLITNEDLRDGLQYGAGAGAFAGFGFGLIDGFLLAQKPGDFGTPQSARGPDTNTTGMISFSSEHNRYNVGLLSPAIYSTADLSRSAHYVKQTPGINLINLKVRL